MNQWSAGLERQLWSGGGLEAAVSGLALLPPGPQLLQQHAARSRTGRRQLAPAESHSLAPIRTFNNDVIANYESMSVIFRQRLTHGLQVLGSYTWSHTLDVTTDSNGGGTHMNPYFWKADYGNSNWDIRHRFVATFVYDIPFFHVSNPLVKGVFAKWQANGIITLQTGFPFNVIDRHRHRQHRRRAAPTGRTWCTRRPRIAGAATWSAASTRPPSRCRICIPLCPRMPTATPAATCCTDLARKRSISPCSRTSRSERLKFQFRFETFALFNHTNFAIPGAGSPGSGQVTNWGQTTFGTSSFGNITASTGNRTIQFGAKLMF